MKNKTVEIVNLKQSFKNASPAVRNQLTLQFEPLINKITAQNHKKFHTDYMTIKSMAYEGFVQAMNEYEPGKAARNEEIAKKDMDFKQYAAFRMLQNIRNRTAEELNIVKLNYYAIKGMKDEEKSSFVTVPIASMVNDSDEKDSSKSLMDAGLYQSAHFADGDVFVNLKTEIDANCNKEDAEIFYRYMGLYGREESKVVDMAKEMNVTSGRISQRLNKVINYVRSNPNLCESLASLMSK